ncbi:MAG: response regulator [Desulfobacter sp.]|nr:MAG: response regulator [Desulfobacter sp.]
MVTIKAKFVFVLLFFFVFFGAATLAVNTYIFLPSFQSIEGDEAVKNAKRVSRAVAREIHHLDSLLHDWSAWDETYTFITSGAGEYIETNLPLSTFKDNAVNLIYFIDTNRKVVYGRAVELDTGRDIVPRLFPGPSFPENHPALNYRTEGMALFRSGLSGIYTTSRGPMILAARPILNNHNQGPVRGTAVMGRLITPALLALLREQTQVDFVLLPPGSSEARPVLADTGEQASRRVVRDKEDRMVYVYEAYPGIEGDTAFVIKSRIPDKISARGRNAMATSLAYILLAGAGAVVVGLLFLKRQVFIPLRRLVSKTGRMGPGTGKKMPVIPSEKNEIKLLETTLDDMFRRLNRQADELKMTNRELKEEIERRQWEEEEKIRVQNLVAEQKKYALVGQIAGKMAHDFNNVLAVIMGSAELLIEDFDNMDVKRTMRLIFDQSQRGKNLTKNLVAFAKDRSPKPEFFNLNGKIEQVVRLMGKDADKVVFRFEAEEALPELFADPGMIEHALVNLVQNALHAVELTGEPEIRIRTFNDRGMICVEVADNGCGIPDAYLDRIYDPSFTLKGSRDKIDAYGPDTKGTGYGLANVKKYVEQHSGNIRVRSGADGGATFILCFPAMEKELTEEEKEALNHSVLHTGKRILIVEDEKEISSIQKQILSRPPFNHRVDVAPDGRRAEELIGKNAYDGICLDYILTGGMNGMDVYRFIREKDKTVPVLFVSGNIEFLESLAGLQKEDPKVLHLSKPCRNKIYVDTINRLLDFGSR